MKAKIAVNFIAHLNSIWPLMFSDSRLKGIDISVYCKLFFIWNRNFFNNPISINRKQFVPFILSKNRYAPSLRRLHNAGYINYKPGRYNTILAEITMTRLDKNETGSNNELLKSQSGTPIVTEPGINNPQNNTLSVPYQLPIIKQENIKQINTYNSNFSEKINREKNINLEAGVTNLGQFENIPEQITPTMPDFPTINKYFALNGFTEDVARKFCQYNNTKGKAFSDLQKDWKYYADIFMARKHKAKKGAFNQVQTENIPYSSKFSLSDEIMKVAIQYRIYDLMGKNERSDNLLAEAYRSNKLNDDLVIKDRPLLIRLAEKIAASNYGKSQLK